jgi:hypothetical protein
MHTLHLFIYLGKRAWLTGAADWSTKLLNAETWNLLADIHFPVFLLIKFYYHLIKLLIIKPPIIFVFF